MLLHLFTDYSYVFIIMFDLKPEDELTIPTIPNELSNPIEEIMVTLFSGRVDRPSARKS